MRFALAPNNLWAVGLSVLALGPAVCLADDAKEILTKADAAAKAAKNVSYDFAVSGIGTNKGKMPETKGSVKMQEGATLGSELFWVSGTKTFVSDPTRQPLVFRAAIDGANAYYINDTARTFLSGAIKDGAAMAARTSDTAVALMIEYVHNDPFGDELRGASQTLEGVKDVGGVSCNVIHVVYSEGMGESRWYFGQSDNLPRAVERLQKDDNNAESGYIISLSNLNANAKFETGAFTLTAPDGYTAKQFEAPKQAAQPELLKVGTVPPDWTLETPTGEKVTLSALKGNIVLLDFWATWCGPCKMAMPGVQALHKHFEGKPVKVFGVNTWERGGDPVKYMKDKEFTYGLLLKGDDVAKNYMITGIPTFYLIGPDGKIMWVGVGHDPGNEKKLTEMIEKKLAEMKG